LIYFYWYVQWFFKNTVRFVCVLRLLNPHSFLTLPSVVSASDAGQSSSGSDRTADERSVLIDDMARCVLPD